MATSFLDLRPNGDGTASGMTVVGSASYWDALNEDPDTPDGDTSYVTPGVDSAGSLFLAVTDLPDSFVSMQGVTVRVAVRMNGTFSDDITEIYAQVFASNETTALTEEVLVTDQSTAGGTYAVDSTAFSTINSPGDKATWEGARLRLRWTYTKNMASDGIALRVTAVELAATLETDPLLQVTSSGGSGTTGSATAYLRRAGNAVGTSATSGVAAPDPITRITSGSGSSSSSGSSDAYRIRRTSASGASTTFGNATARQMQAPVAVIELWEAGSFVATLDTVEISPVGEVLTSVTWDPSLLNDPEGRDVELRVVTTPSGEGATAEIGAIEWNAGGQAILLVPVSASGGSTTAGSAAYDPTKYPTASGGSSTTGSSSAYRNLSASVVGASVSLGTSLGGIRYAASSAGQSLTTGAADAYRLLRAVASGQTLANGAASPYRILQAISAGSSTSEGLAAALLHLQAAATGSSLTTGVSDAYRILQPLASGAATSLGSVAGLVPTRLAATAGSSTSTGSSLAIVPLRLVVATGNSATLGVSSPIRTRITGIVPDIISEATNLPVDPVSVIQDDPDADNGVWLEAASAGATSTMIRIGFTVPPDDVFGEQTYRVLVRAR